MSSKITAALAIAIATPWAIIATAKAVRTLGVEHTQWHLVDNQTGRVACEFDF